jgi:hypothetical protein
MLTSTPARMVAVLVAVVAVGVAAAVMRGRDGTGHHGTGSNGAAVDARVHGRAAAGSATGAADDAAAAHGGDGAAAGDRGRHDRRAARRDWQAGERREAWQRDFGARVDGLDDGESISDFVAESTGPAAKERRLEKRRARAEEAEDRAAVTGSASPSTVFQSPPGSEFETLNQSEPTELPDLTGESGTVSFWVTPAWDANSQDDTAFITIGDGNIRVYKNVSYLRVEFTGEDGRKASLGVPISEWGPGDAHQVTTTWNETTHQMELFVDDKLVSQNVYDVGMKLDKPKLAVGSNEPWTRPIAPGMLSHVEVRNQAASRFNVSRRFFTIQRQQQAAR